MQGVVFVCRVSSPSMNLLRAYQDMQVPPPPLHEVLFANVRAYVRARGVVSVMVGALVAIGLFTSVFSIQAVTNRTNLPINYQGRLTDTNYVPVNDAARNVEFFIYNALSGGTCQWATGASTGAANCTTPGPVSVVVDRGLFSVPLGSTATNNPQIAVNFDSGLFYLEVRVFNGASYETLSPRKQLGSTPYAYNADLLDNIDATGFANLTGQAGGQVLQGGTAASENLTLQSTANVTKGKILFGTSGYDEVNNRLGVLTASPSAAFSVGATNQFQINTTGAITAATGITDTGTISNTGAITSAGGAVSLNLNSNFATSISTGTSTGAITLGGGAGTFAIASTALDVSTAGVISGATGLTSSGTITLSGLTASRTVFTDASSNLAVSAASSVLASSITDETGTGVLVLGTTPVFTTNITDPLVIGGTTATSTLALRSTSGTGAAGADILFQTGTNGATEAARILNNGNFGIGDASPASLFTVGSGDLFQINSSGDIIKIKNVTYSWPSTQGAASTALVNDGSGNLSWSTVSGGSSGTGPGINWTTRTTPADNGWLSIAYGNGLYVAVSNTGTGNRVMTSSDGITWTSRTSAADVQWWSVTYGAGLFVAVAYDGGANTVMTSPDGVTWTLRTTPSNNAWVSVTYSGSLFVAVSDNNTTSDVMTSPDGITWTLRTGIANSGWDSVIYGNGLFVAVSELAGSSDVMTSPDGITWTSRTGAASNSWRVVTYGNSLFVAVSYTGTGNRVMTSPDGITWTSRSSAADNSWQALAYGSGLFVAISGNNTMTSPDGITWTSHSASANNGWYGATYGNGQFVAVANSGTGNRVMTSSSTAGSGGTALSSITDAASSDTLINGDNAQVWNWALTTASKTGFTFGETTASTATGTPVILGANTLASSTAIPLYVTNLGNATSFRVDDSAADTTPFIIDASGNVAIGNTSATSALNVGSTNQFQVSSAGAIAAATGITNTGAITNTGGIVNLNVSSNFATNISTGTSTGAITDRKSVV